MKRILILLVTLFLNAGLSFSQSWVPDLGNGRYKNPVLYADYSDPDIIRVGDDFYLVASSFNCMPGIPVLHSRDLVNWTIIGHVYQRLPFQKFDKPVHGEGSWAPSIRYHNGLFYVYFCTPFEGLFVATTRNPAGKWKLHEIAKVEMWEDPCPLWDSNGNAYLVRSKLRAGTLYLHRMSKDGMHLLDNGRVIFHDDSTQPTIEGPKMLKINGYYYIFSPAGGVSAGWQTVLRSKNIYGPYEAKVVMRQGSTDVNGPHQGGIVELKSGEWWFMHFSERGAYGRIDYLEPVSWKDGWPIIGADSMNSGIGEPVTEWRKPDVGRTYPVAVPQTSDEFNSSKLDLQWQWSANPQTDWYSLNGQSGRLRLYAVQNPTQDGNLWFVPNLLLQKFPAPSFTVTTKISFHPAKIGERSGLVIMGKEWAFIAFTATNTGSQIGMFTGTYHRGYDGTEVISTVPARQTSCLFRVHVDSSAVCTFSYSFDGKVFHEIGKEFKAAPGVWIGAKVGLFSEDPNIVPGKGYADFDWFRFE